MLKLGSFWCCAVLCCTAPCCMCHAREQVLRSGEELEYEIQMQPLQTLVPVHKYDQLPSYFIYSGASLREIYTIGS